MARTWLTSDPLVRPVEDVPEDLLAAEVDRERVEHLRVLDERLVGERRACRRSCGRPSRRRDDRRRGRGRASGPRTSWPAARPGPGRGRNPARSFRLATRSSSGLAFMTAAYSGSRVAISEVKGTSITNFGLKGEEQDELDVGAQGELHAVLEGRGDEDRPGELAGMAAGQVVGDEPAHALAEQEDFLSREVPLRSSPARPGCRGPRPGTNRRGPAAARASGRSRGARWRRTRTAWPAKLPARKSQRAEWAPSPWTRRKTALGEADPVVADGAARRPSGGRGNPFLGGRSWPDYNKERAAAIADSAVGPPEGLNGRGFLCMIRAKSGTRRSGG